MRHEAALLLCEVRRLLASSSSYVFSLQVGPSFGATRSPMLYRSITFNQRRGGLLILSIVTANENSSHLKLQRLLPAHEMSGSAICGADCLPCKSRAGPLFSHMVRPDQVRDAKAEPPPCPSGITCGSFGRVCNRTLQACVPRTLDPDSILGTSFPRIREEGRLSSARQHRICFSSCKTGRIEVQ